MRKKRTVAGKRAAASKLAEDDGLPPLTAAEIGRLRPVSLAKKIRWKLGLSQADFAKRYRIPLGTLRDWEQHRAIPDAASRAYLMVIEAEPGRTAKVHDRAGRSRTLERA